MKTMEQGGQQKTPSVESKTAVQPKRPEGLSPWGEDFERMADFLDWRRGDWFRRPFPELWQPMKGLREKGLLGLSMPVVDLFEDQEKVTVKAEIPGLDKKDVEVKLTDSRLTIKGEKKKEEEVKEEDYSYSERSYGSFARVLQLPCQVKGDKVKASFKNGVLEITLPKSEEAKSRSVNVKID